MGKETTSLKNKQIKIWAKAAKFLSKKTCQMTTVTKMAPNHYLKLKKNRTNNILTKIR